MSTMDENENKDLGASPKVFEIRNLRVEIEK
jgi:hypothetical protein